MRERERCNKESEDLGLKPTLWRTQVAVLRKFHMNFGTMQDELTQWMSSSFHNPEILIKYEVCHLGSMWFAALHRRDCGIYCSQPPGGDPDALASLLGELSCRPPLLTSPEIPQMRVSDRSPQTLSRVQTWVRGDGGWPGAAGVVWQDGGALESLEVNKDLEESWRKSRDSLQLMRRLECVCECAGEPGWSRICSFRIYEAQVNV